MQLIATHINYYHICHRKLWLFANSINMEHTSDIVYDGKLLHETSYPQRAERYTEIELSATYNDQLLSGKIDFFDTKEKIIHEIKRSDKVEKAHEWQAKFYIWLLELNGILNAYAILEYTKLRETKEINLTEEERLSLRNTINKIFQLVFNKECPPKINSKICKSCSYYEFCYIDEP